MKLLAVVSLVVDVQSMLDTGHRKGKVIVRETRLVISQLFLTITVDDLMIIVTIRDI